MFLGKPGFREDIIVVFNYATITIDVQHIREDTNSIIKGLDGGNLEYSMGIRGATFIVPSLNTYGENTLEPTGEKYNITGSSLSKVQIVESNKTIVDISSSEIGNESRYYWILTSSNQKVSIHKSEIFRTDTKITIKFYYKISDRKLTVRHVDTNGNQLARDELYPLSKTPDPTLTVSPKKQLYNAGYVNVKYTDVSGDHMPPYDNVQVVDDGVGDKTITFVYDVAMVVVKHQDTEGNPLAPDEYIPLPPTGTDVGPNEEVLKKYVYDHYEDENGPHDPADTVHVPNDNSTTRKTVVFVYDKKDDTTPATPPTDIPQNNNAETIVKLRSNDRGSEEYDVDGGSIPTSEDLYANVITDSFLLRDSMAIKDTTTTLNIKLRKAYYVRNDTDNGTKPVDTIDYDERNITVVLPYQYYTGEKAELDILSRAVLSNDAIVSKEGDTLVRGSVTVKPTYPQEPHMDYKRGGIIGGFDKIGNETPRANSGVRDPKFDNETGQLLSFTYDIPEEPEHRKPNMAAVEKQYSDVSVIISILQTAGAVVSTDKLSVITETGDTWTVLSGNGTSIGRLDYTADELKRDTSLGGFGCTHLFDSPPQTTNDTLYRDNDIYVQTKVANATYNTTADIYYKFHQYIVGDEPSDAGDIEFTTPQEDDVKGNDIVVHTPVVDYAKLKLDENNKDNQLINAEGNVIVMGKKFTVNIPNSGTHLNRLGYKTKLYNFQGLIEADDEFNSNIENEWLKGTKTSGGLTFEPEKYPGGNGSFAQLKQIKFDFGVIFQNVDDKDPKYYPKNTWISLNRTKEDYDFTIPTWEEEVWNGKTVKVYTRVIAENAPESSLTSDSGINAIRQVNANTESKNYVAYKDIDVKVIGRMYDIQIRATNDTGWANFKDNKALTADQFPVGQANQNAVAAYKYGLKLGASTYFDLKVDGNYGQTSNKIEIVPKYYFVSKDGGNAQEVDLYYHTLTERYVNLADNPITLTTRMSLNNGAKYFPNYNTFLGKTLQLLGNKYDYTALYNIGNTNKLELNDMTRIITYSTIAEILAQNGYNQSSMENVTDTNKVINSIGRWYGEIRVPASTIIATHRTGINDVKAGKGVLKGGYLIVTLDSVITKDSTGKDYLSYAKPDGNTQWTKEKADQDMTLPNGKPALVPAGQYPFIIYESDVRINNDYEATGTH